MEKQVDNENSNNQTEEIQYDPNKTPSDIVMAKKHLKAKSIGKVRNINTINPDDICPCCGCVIVIIFDQQYHYFLDMFVYIDKEKIDVTVDINELGFLGSGVSLYFFFIKYCIVFLILIGIFSSIFNIMSNYSGSACKKIQTCDANAFSNNFSVINRDNPLDKFNTAAGLNLLTTFVLIVASIISQQRQLIYFLFRLRKQMKRMSKQIDIDNVTPSDFTVMISNIKFGTTEEELKQYIKSWLRSYGEVKILKVVFAYNISEYIETKRFHQQVGLTIIQEKTRLEKMNEQTSEKLKDLTEEEERIEKKLVELETQLKSENFSSCGTAFMTFSTDNTAEQVVDLFKKSFFGTFWRNVTGYGTLNGQVIVVKRAPEPTDIFWENLCYTFTDRLKSKCITYFLTAVLLTVCFFIIFAISQAQSNISVEKKDSALIQFLSFLASFCLFVINTSISMIIKKFALFEKHQTLTHYFIGVAEKSGIAQFFNTTIIVFIIKKLKWENEIYASGGLLSTITFIVLMNFVSAFNLFLNPWYFMKLLNRKKLENGNTNLIAKTPQYKAHEIFEDNKFDFPQNFAKHIKLIMFSSFYSYAAPLIIYVSIFIMLVSYWIDKYHLIRRCQIPDTVSQLLPNAMADFYLELMIVIYCIGNMVFEKLLYDKISGLTIAALALAIIFWVLDFDSITDICCQFYKDEFAIKRYEQYSFQFLTDYERSNPVTAMKAIEEWQKKLQDSKIQSSGNQKQQNSFSILSNYALSRPGMSTYAPRFAFQQPQFRQNMPYQYQMQQNYQQGSFQMGQFPKMMMPQFQNNQLRSQFSMGGMPGINFIQVFPLNQSALNMDPSVLQNEINNLQTMQLQLQNQLQFQIHPQIAIQLINQMERNKQRIEYLNSQIQQQTLNISLQNPLLAIAPVSGQQNLTNPLLNMSNQIPSHQVPVQYNQPKQQGPANPLIISPSINPMSNQNASNNTNQITNPMNNIPTIQLQTSISNPSQNNNIQPYQQQHPSQSLGVPYQQQISQQQQIPQQQMGIQYPQQQIGMQYPQQQHGMNNMQLKPNMSNQFGYQQQQYQQPQQNFPNFMSNPGMISMVPTQQQVYYQQNKQY